MPMQKVIDVYGFITDRCSVFGKTTPQEALTKLEAYEKSKEIKTGDVVESINTGRIGVITKVEENGKYVIFADGTSGMFAHDDIRKTGKHIDITSVLEQLRGGMSMGAGMNLEEAQEIANKMSFADAVFNAIGAKCVPYRKATKIKLNELLEIAKDVDATNKWIPCEVRLPEEDGKRYKRYLVQQTNGNITVLGFTKDAYKFDRNDFALYKGKKKALFYSYDSKWGFCECECIAWMPLPAPYKKGE